MSYPPHNPYKPYNPYQPPGPPRPPPIQYAQISNPYPQQRRYSFPPPPPPQKSGGIKKRWILLGLIIAVIVVFIIVMNSFKATIDHIMCKGKGITKSLPTFFRIINPLYIPQTFWNAFIAKNPTCWM